MRSIDVVCIDFPKVHLSSAVDAVFIGGHGGHLEEMTEKVKQVLQPGGCIVFNSVSAESKEAFRRGIEQSGMVLHPSTRIALNEYNPIEIMKATLS